jgi:uncharacterized protein (TIGR02266 family)
MKIYCPYCTQETILETDQCLTCGVFYDDDTLRFLGIAGEKALCGHTDERRKQARFRKKYKITFPTSKAFLGCYLSDISTGGVFIKTDRPLSQGEKVHLRLSLPDGEKELETSGEVAWCRAAEQATPEEKCPAGMGIKFLNMSTEGKKRVVRMLCH